MSLVGSLEDLGLGDILQIIGLSRKTGVLTLRSPEGEGRIVFHDGRIRSAWLKQGPTDLRELLASRSVLPADELEKLAEAARAEGMPFERIVLDRGGLDAERLDALRREHVEGIVLTLFRWERGEFSFEMRDPVADEERSEMCLAASGLNPQFLALEGARLVDEDGAPGGEIGAGGEGELALPAEGDVAASAEAAKPAPAEVPAASDAPRPPVVIIDPDLAVLEWAKNALAGTFARVHIFQNTELAISRIRQYLGRFDVPIVVLSDEAPPDPVSGARGYADIAVRLRAQAPQMRIVLLAAESDAPRPPELGTYPAAVRPRSGTTRSDPEAEALAGKLREALLAACAASPEKG